MQRAIRGVDLTDAEDDAWIGEIRAGIGRGFMGLDSTLEDYMLSKNNLNRGTTWYPRHFQRAAIGAWVKAGQPRLEDRLRAEVAARIARHEYELDATRRDAVERIYRAARVAVTEN